MIRYRDAVVSDMREVAQVHILTQPQYFTSTLGIDLLEKFYTEFLIEDNLFVVAIDDICSKIVGFCMGNYYVSTAEKRWEKKYKIEIVKKLFFNCIKLNKLAVSRVVSRIMDTITKKQIKRDDYFAHLLSLGVLEEYRGNHIASDLIDAFEMNCLKYQPDSLKNKEKICTIGAYKWNNAGCRLYAYKGYSVFEETQTKLKFSKKLCN